MFSTPVLARNRPCRQRAISASVDRLPTGAECVDAIIATFSRATPAEFAAGMSWYSGTARQACDDIRSTVQAVHGRTITHRCAAGILAALSPATGWGDNTAGAIEFVVSGSMLTQTPLFNERARSILNGADPADVLGGRKVRSFFANLEAPNYAGAVTIDRHALAILFLRPLTEREQKTFLSLGAYTFAAGAYRAAARRLGLLPHELQAITWLVWRREHPYRGRDADQTHSTAQPEEVF